MGGLDPAYMDAAARLGLGVIASPGSSAGSAFDAAKVRETVRRWDRHPALAGWYLIDEPDLNEVPVEQVELAQDTVKAAGAKKPTALVVFRGWNLAKFHTADLLMVDFYPVGWIPVPAFFQHMRHGVTAARVGGKQFYAVIQAMDWAAYEAVFPFPPPFAPRPPTEAELRSMTWGCSSSGGRRRRFLSLPRRLLGDAPSPGHLEGPDQRGAGDSPLGAHLCRASQLEAASAFRDDERPSQRGIRAVGVLVGENGEAG